MTELNRRRFLQVTAAGAVATSVLGTSALTPKTAQAATTYTWISPRGTIEVLDDYPYWVAKEMGYFGDIDTRLEPGPSDGTATVKFVALGQADMGYPSPGVFSFALENELDLVSVFNMGARDVFDFAFRPGEGFTDLRQMEGKTVLLGSAAWQSIADPIFAAAGADVTKIKYIEAGWPQWGTILASGEGDAALAWEGLRADWEGKGLKFEYWLGVDQSVFPANSFVVKRSDTQDPEKRKILGQYLRGWAMGLEFGEHNPRAATDIVFKSLPIVKSNLGADLGTESMLQLANVFRGNMDERQGWGYHDWGSWKAYFKTIRRIGQLKRDVNVGKVISNDFIGAANDFDVNKVMADAKGYTLSADLAKVDVDKIKGRFYANVVK
ncbi:MAG: ABC transporter substrate-binding protein [Deltaproteobacteria bacterium]|nr:ABC transporter substrate-binding protein [Deltaproteobacteria bacterium]MBT7205231.1 ABC transporter substrate-binding protein [Deltaproteobacteria bacterium]MDG2199365.1 ABC transporter substrate-binding protein [SAR324 cluster bacterium]